MKKILATEKERLDEIVYREYKTLEVFEKVLEHNPHLTSKIILNMGEIVNLPIISIKKENEKEESLW